MKDPRPKRSKGKPKKHAAKPKSAKSSEEAVTVEQQGGPAVWRPGQDPIGEEETLDYDPTAYDCLHALSLDYPCLSFDLLKDSGGGPRSSFPHSLYFAAATQADTPRANYLAFVRIDNLQQGRHAKKAANGDDDDDSMSESSDEDEEGGPPVLHARMLGLPSGANRVRAMPQRPGVAAVFEESGTVKVFDGTAQLDELAAVNPETSSRARVSRPAVLQSFRHSTEGFAVDWSRAAAGCLATGDNNARIHVWEPEASGTSWAVSGVYKGHTASVEDLQWSPVEATVFASASADRSVRIWDSRARSRPQLTVTAHASDVNVITWNAETSHMLASGGDEGALKVWDLRAFAEGRPVADFSHHRAAVTSVEWCPWEASMLATTGADGQLCVWDLALERDPEEEAALADGGNAAAPADLPPQLLFVHGGQTDLKEVHWHRQIPGMLLSTAADGFNVFKPSNVG